MAPSLLRHDATSSAQLDFEMFCCSSLLILSGFVGLDRESVVMTCSGLPEMFAGVQLRELLFRRSCVVLAVCRGSLSCWKLTLHPNLSMNPSFPLASWLSSVEFCSRLLQSSSSCPFPQDVEMMEATVLMTT